MRPDIVSDRIILVLSTKIFDGITIFILGIAHPCKAN